MVAATTAGTQPPCENLAALAMKKPRSMISSGTITTMATIRFHFHNRHMTMNSRIAVTSISPVTAMP